MRIEKKLAIFVKKKKISASIVEYDIERYSTFKRKFYTGRWVFILSNSEMNLLEDVYAAGYPFGRIEKERKQ